MAKHMVTCVHCGRRFDANMGAYYNSATRRYSCKACGKKVNQAYKRSQRTAAADQREVRTGMRQSLGAMIAKIAFGAIFIISCIGSEIQTFLVGLVLGGALIAWGLVPYLRARQQKQEAQAEQEAIRSAPKQCKNCGAFTSGNYCEYCGSPLQ